MALYDCVHISKLLGATGVYPGSKKVWSSHVHTTCILGILYSGLTLAGSHPLAAAAHGLCSCSASSGLSRCLEGSQCIHTRATLGWETRHVGITRRFASKAHSSCKLEHDGIIPFKCQAKKNRSLLLSKDRKHRKGISHSREGTLTALVPSPGKRVNSRHKHVTCYRALAFTFELTKHTLSVLADFVMILHIRS